MLKSKKMNNTIISFSGGRTSGMMLKTMIDECGGSLPDNVKVLFANTGKELNETLDFVNECSINWNVPIIWLEYVWNDDPQKRWREVTYKTASRNGEPFEALLLSRKFLPNPTMRFCTQDLKVRAMKLYAQQVLGWKEWDVAIGFRADEQRRVAKLSMPSNEPYERYAPLVNLNVTAKDVANFWDKQSFDLRLSNNNGKTMHGNCDLCFLKGANQVLSLIKENPARADWWIKMESIPRTKTDFDHKTGTFRKDRPSYSAMKEFALKSNDMFGFDEDSIECVGCTD